MTRYIALEGASNFRDFGGYPTVDGGAVKWQTLYRSDRLSGLTPADYETLAARNIRLVCDLRRHAEQRHAPTQWLCQPAPELWHAPLFDDSVSPSALKKMQLDESARQDPQRVRERMLDIYRHMVSEAGALARFQAIFARLAQPESYPVLIHCSGGKDRTGVTCALLLLLAGVHRDDVMADYLLTRDYYRGYEDLKSGGAQVFDRYGMSGWSLAALEPIYTVEEAYLEAALQIVEREYGSVPLFLERAVGMTPAQLAAIRRHLLEPSPAGEIV